MRRLARGFKLLTVAGVTVYSGQQAYAYMNKDKLFVQSMNLVFPDYSDENKQVKVISRNQLEYVIRQCNQYNKTVVVPSAQS